MHLICGRRMMAALMTALYGLMVTSHCYKSCIAIKKGKSLWKWYYLLKCLCYIKSCVVISPQLQQSTITSLLASCSTEDGVCFLQLFSSNGKWQMNVRSTSQCTSKDCFFRGFSCQDDVNSCSNHDQLPTSKYIEKLGRHRHYFFWWIKGTSQDRDNTIFNLEQICKRTIDCLVLLAHWLTKG